MKKIASNGRSAADSPNFHTISRKGIFDMNKIFKTLSIFAACAGSLSLAACGSSSTTVAGGGGGGDAGGLTRFLTIPTVEQLLSQGDDVPGNLASGLRSGTTYIPGGPAPAGSQVGGTTDHGNRGGNQNSRSITFTHARAAVPAVGFQPEIPAVPQTIVIDPDGGFDPAEGPDRTDPPVTYRFTEGSPLVENGKIAMVVNSDQLVNGDGQIERQTRYGDLTFVVVSGITEAQTQGETGFDLDVQTIDVIVSSLEPPTSPAGETGGMPVHQAVDYEGNWFLQSEGPLVTGLAGNQITPTFRNGFAKGTFDMRVTFGDENGLLSRFAFLNQVGDGELSGENARQIPLDPEGIRSCSAAAVANGRCTAGLPTTLAANGGPLTPIPHTNHFEGITFKGKAGTDLENVEIKNINGGFFGPLAVEAVGGGASSQHAIGFVAHRIDPPADPRDPQAPSGQ